MTTESSELTFVRCPACRSLVPAVSTRCRMCGGALNSAQAKEEEAAATDDKKAPKRVRQKTMSVSPEEMQEQLSQIEEASAAEAAAINEIADPEQIEDGDDPLSDFLTDEDDINDDDLVGDEDLEEDPYFEDEDEENESPVQAPNVPEAKPEAQRVVVEQGGRRPQSGGGLNFGKPRDTAPEQKTMAVHPREAERPSPFGKQATPQRKTPVDKVKKEEVSAGRLYGWLVDYSNGAGTSIEIREGKFFVTSQKLRDSDLVLNDPEVSTPHAMVTISVDGGMQLQDLNSEHGTYVRSKGTAEFLQEFGVVQIENGDAIRFGESEFLVCLIAHVGIK